jgi:CheY-like chemotaxis protein
MEKTGTDCWLVVEDDEDDYILLRRAFRSVANRPALIWLRNGEEAQSSLAESSHDVTAIVSDIKMPRMNGLELLQWLRKHPTRKTTPFFMLSSSDLARDVKQALKEGVQDYQVKPRESRTLVRILAGWVDVCASPV